MKWMDLVLLSLKKQLAEIHCRSILLIAIFNCFAYSQSAYSQSQEFNSFADAKAYLLNQISAANESVQLYTEFLTDGEFISSLYLAKFRKIKTTVLLNPGQANHFLSRLRDLKKQEIDVYFSPRNFPRAPKTALLIDQNRVLFFDAALDYQTRGQRFIISELKAPEAALYRTTFADAVAQSIEPKSIWALPSVGRSRPQASPAVNNRRNLPVQRYQSNHPETQGAYHYQTNRNAPIPTNIPRQLPKETIWQKKQRDLESAQDVAKTPSQPTPPTYDDQQGRLPNDWRGEEQDQIDVK